MKIKKVVCAALMLSLSMSLLACVPESQISAYDKGRENPIEVVCRPLLGAKIQNPATILRDNETGVEYIYVNEDNAGVAIYPRLDKDGKPVVHK